MHAAKIFYSSLFLYLELQFSMNSFNSEMLKFTKKFLFVLRGYWNIKNFFNDFHYFHFEVSSVFSKLHLHSYFLCIFLYKTQKIRTKQKIRKTAKRKLHIHKVGAFKKRKLVPASETIPSTSPIVFPKGQLFPCMQWGTVTGPITQLTELCLTVLLPAHLGFAPLPLHPEL